MSQTKGRTSQKRNSIFPEGGRRRVPEDNEVRDEALKPFRLYGRTMTAAISKLFHFLSDEPLDEEEREAHIEAITVLCYQYNVTALDGWVCLTIAMGSALVARAPAIQKKWAPSVAEREAKRRTQRASEEAARERNAKPVEGLRLTPPLASEPQGVA